MKFRAVLFDLDGTLLNTLQDLTDALNHGLALMSLPPHTPAEVQYFVGEGREEMVRRALPEDRRDPATIRQLVDLSNEYYGVHWCDHTRPYPGVPELLDALTERGLNLAIFSNKPHNFTVENAAGLLGRWKFARVLGVSESTPKKPDSTAPRRIAAELKLSTADFVYLGDSGTDMRTAVAAGMYPAGALWGFRTADDLKANGAEILIKYPTDLLKILQ